MSSFSCYLDSYSEQKLNKKHLTNEKLFDLYTGADTQVAVLSKRDFTVTVADIYPFAIEWAKELVSLPENSTKLSESLYFRRDFT